MFQINSAVSTDRNLNQWIDLGIHTDVCITRPDTCGAAGGAVSLWLRLLDCGEGQLSGLITSTPDSFGSTGFIIACAQGRIW